MKTVYLVTYQLPKDLVVGVYEDEDQAQKHYDEVPDKRCPLLYPCPIDMIKRQSGYSKRLDKIVNKLLRENKK